MYNNRFEINDQPHDSERKKRGMARKGSANLGLGNANPRENLGGNSRVSKN